MPLDLSKAKFHPTSEKLVGLLVKKTQNNNPAFFRVLLTYHLARIASMMRVTIATHDRGDIPVNAYAINLSSSGTGKTYSNNIIEEQIIHKFKEVFLNSTFPDQATKHLAVIANSRAKKNPGTDLSQIEADCDREFSALGPLAFSFDSGTAPAVKQMRQKLLMANIGSINLEIDEIGSNLVNQTEVLNTFLELFDVGKVKSKLTKNTKDNTRHEDIDGKTPANMMLYGTPSKLLNGSKTEDEFYSMLEAGYARRCFFGYSKQVNKLTDYTPEQLYDMLTDSTSEAFLEKFADRLAALADSANYNMKIQMTKDVSLLLLEYRIKCEQEAESLKDHEEILKAELSHRYYKALKLAGAYAFIDGNLEISEDNLYAAIRLAEESGEALKRILTRERNYVKLAKYISSIGREVTQVDLVEELPFYKGSEYQKRELMALAVAYGYKHNIVIKKTISDGIEFFEGEAMEETNLDNMILAYSNDITRNYVSMHNVPFDRLHELCNEEGLHWCNHQLKDYMGGK